MEHDNTIRTFVLDDSTYLTQYTKKYDQRKPYAKPNPDVVCAFIPGIIHKIYVKAGQTVRRGDKLLVLEAMKMNNDLSAHRDGVIKAVLVNEGDMVKKHQTLIEFQSAEGQ